MRRLSVLAAALVALAAVVLPGQSAHAQTTVWSATLTVNEVSNRIGCGAISSLTSCLTTADFSGTIRLTDRDFDHGGTTYDVVDLYIDKNTDPDRMRFSVIGRVSNSVTVSTGQQIKTALGSMTLNLGTVSLAISSATVPTSGDYIYWPKGSLSWSSGDTVSVSLTVPADNTRPAKPTGLTAASGNKRVTLNWANPSDSTITKWQYRQKTTGNYGGWQNISGSSATTTRHTVTGLMNGTQYTFQVRAHDAGGAGATSDAVSATPAATVMPVTPPAGFWSATLTVDDDEDYFGCDSTEASMDSCSSVSVLTDDDFEFGGVTYTISELWWYSEDDQLSIVFSGLSAVAAKAPLNSLTLHIGASSFTFASATAENPGGAIYWTTDLGWTDNQVVKLSMSAPPPPAPTVSSVAVTSSVPDNQNGHYKIGDTVTATATFSAAVNVTGTPRLELQVGSNARRAAYAGGTGTTALTFDYTVVEGDEDSDGIAIGTNKLTLPGSATIKETTGVTNANRNFSAVAANSAQKVDGVRPTVTGTSAHGSAGVRGTGYTQGVRVTFSEAVMVTGTPTITIRVGANDRTASYVSQGSDSDEKGFNYVVQANEEDLDGVGIVANSLTVPSDASIKDDAGNAATITHSAATFAGYKVDSKPPVAPTNFAASPGNTEAVLTWADPDDESIAKWQFQQKEGTGSYGSWTNISGSDKDTITHTATGLTNGTSYGFKVRAVDIGANDGAASAEATATPVMADTTAPTVSSVALTSSVPDNQNGHYKIGDKITATVTFSEAVDVTGKPRLALQVGSNARRAVYAGGSGATALTFDYTVREGDEDTDGIAIGSNKLTLPGSATIEDGSDNAANRNHAAVAANAAHKVDGVRPTITGIELESTGAVSSSGEEVTAVVEFSEGIQATGAPTLAVRVGSNVRTATCCGGGADSGTLRFPYSVQANEEDLGGVSVDANSLTLPSNNASIKDDAGNDATVTHNAVPDDSNAKVDSKPPVAPTNFMASPGNAEAVLTWTDPGDESIAKWQFQQKEGTLSYGAWTDIAGSDKDTITYTVTGLTNDTSYRFKLRAVDIGANDGAASAEATATPTAVDNTDPTVSSVALTSSVPSNQDGHYGIGDTVTATVTFNEAVDVTGKPELELQIGSNARAAVYAAGSGGTALSFDYTVVEGDADTDGIAIGSNKLTLSGGTIEDGSDNAANRNHSAVAANSAHKVDGVRPKITGIAVTSTPNRDDTYGVGESIEFTVTFDGPVNVVVKDFGPAVRFRMGTVDDVQARYRRGSATTEVVFGPAPLPSRYQDDTDGISMAANPFVLLGGTIKDASNNEADLSWPAGLRAQSGHKVDTFPPAAPTGLTATPGNGQVTLSWTAPTPTDASIVGYQYQQRVGTGAWGAWTDIPGSRRTTTSYTVRELGVLQYGFRVRAQDAANDGAASDEATATPDDGARPVKPAGFSASAGHARVTLSWSDPGDATITKYQIRQGSGAWADIPGSGASTTSHTVTGLVVGRAYTFRIRAVDGVGAGTLSAAVSVTPTAAPPDQVTDVQVTAAGRWPKVDRWLDVTWPPVPGAENYSVQWKSGDEAFVDDASRRRLVNQGRTRGGRMHTAIKRLRGGVEYTVRVTALFPDRPDGPPSEEAQGTPYPGLIETIAATPGAQGLDVSWTPVGGYGLYGYKVYWKAHADRERNDVRSAEVMGGATGTHLIPTADLPAGDGFDVWVAVLFRDVDGNEHEAGTSDEVTDVRPPVPVSDTAPAAPGDVAAVAAGPKAIVLSWTAPAGATGYTVQWATAAGGPWTAGTADLGASATGYDHTGLTGGTTRHYRVRATNAAGASVWSATVSATTPTSAPGPVQGVTVAPGIGELTVRWTALSGALHYKVQWKSGDVAFVDDASRQRITSVRDGAHMTIERLRSDTEYTVRVIAMWPGQEDSPPSAEATGTPLAHGAPQGDLPQLQVTVTPGPGSGRLRVSWDAVESATGYEVKWWRTSAPEGAVTEAAGDLHTLEDLTPGVEYTVQVRAVYGAVEPTRHGPWSAEATGTPLAPPVLTVSDAQAQEGGRLGFAVALSAAAEETVTVDYATAGGTARAGEDYEAASGTLRFAAGETEKTVEVVLLDDADAEDDETLTLRLSDPSGATLGTPEATGTVTDATPLPSLAVADAAAAEGESLAFAVTLDAAASAAVTVDWTTADGTAEAGADYASASGTLTFAAGETAKTVEVALLDDTDAEADETLTLRLSNPSGATLADAEATGTVTDATPAAPLTAHVAAAPDEHGGRGMFNVRLGFSAALASGAAAALEGGALTVDGGTVKDARRVDGRRDLYRVRIRPGSKDDVTLTLSATTDCAAPTALCTSDGRPLSAGLTHTVAGPAALSVKDARGREGAGAVLAFKVRLSRAASGTVTVDYATRDRSAKAGEDYEAASGTLTFAAGETRKTVEVTLLDDTVDEGKETFRLRLSNASGAVLAKDRATGTIVNSDPLPAAWLARFARASADQTLEAIGARVDGTGAAGDHFTFGGARLFGGPAMGGFGADDGGIPAWRPGTGPGTRGADPSGEPGDTRGGAMPMDALGAPGGGYAAPGRASGHAGGKHGSGMYGSGMDGSGMDGGMAGPALGHGTGRTLRDALLGSSFLATLGGADGDGAPRRLAAWGNVAASTFGGEADGVALDGDVTTALLGADAAWGRWLAGVALARSFGTGSYRAGERGDGRLESVLTTVNPYLRYAVNDRLSAWGALGFGGGSVTLEDAAADAAWETDTAMRMAAAGARGVFVRTENGLELAGRVDARLVRIASDAASNGFGNLAASAAETNRLRVVLEGSRAFAFGTARTLTPTLEIGLRRDGGDAETGAGVELGGTLRYADADLGLTAEAAARMLAAHQDADYREWGASALLRLDPKTPGRGLALTLAPAWGASAVGGAERLWSLHDARGLAGYAPEAGMRLATDVGYGLSAFRGRGAMTPYVGMASMGGGGRDWRAGVRWTRGPGLEFGFEATRSADGGEPAMHGLLLRFAWRPGAGLVGHSLSGEVAHADAQPH